MSYGPQAEGGGGHNGTLLPTANEDGDAGDYHRFDSDKASEEWNLSLVHTLGDLATTFVARSGRQGARLTLGYLAAIASRDRELFFGHN